MVLLHGHGQTGALINRQMGGEANQADMNYVLLIPEGTAADDGRQFWNATPACCGDDPTVDDVGYLIGLVDELAEHAPVDPDRVYFTGHSNGGFMSYRMACEHPDRIAAIMPLAGSTFDTPEECAVGAPVSVLHVHGTLDSSVPYEGNDEYPGALAAAARWAERAGCDPDAASAGTPLDLMTSLEGAETEVLEFREGCEGGKSVDLWTLVDGGHVPAFTEAFADEVLPWLLARSL